MRSIGMLVLGFLLLLMSCRGGKQIPDVSGIEVKLTVERFERDFFALDTLNLQASLEKLVQQYPGFSRDFLFNILGTTPASVTQDIPMFLRSYAELNRDAQQLYPDMKSTEAAVKKGLQFVKYYFPQYVLPTRLVTFIGPVNSYGNIITTNTLAVGLQLYMGNTYPLYLSEAGQQLYPRFISKRFEPAYIPVNCIRNILDDMYPANYAGMPMIDQMVEAGKRWYVLDKLMPETADSLKTGYTDAQLKGCFANEKNIWSFFIQNKLLYETDPEIIRDYMSDAPNTPALGKDSPGFIGQFVGIQIVTKWMTKQSQLPLDSLMKTPARRIFEEARYKP